MEEMVMKRLSETILVVFIVLCLCIFISCGKVPIPLGSTSDQDSQELVEIEDGLAKIGAELNVEKAEDSRVSIRIKRYLDYLGKLLRRINNAVGDEKGTPAKRYLNVAKTNYVKARQALKNENYRSAIRYLKKTREMAAGSIYAIKTGKPLPQHYNAAERVKTE